jgi:ABC-type phosphate/phosphonate transport system permease subunit
LEEFGNPRRRASIIRVLKVLSQPNLFEYEYETLETPIVLKISCSKDDNAKQVEQVNSGSLTLELECPTTERPKLIIHGEGFQPGLTGHIALDANARDRQYQTPTNIIFEVDRRGNFSISTPFYEELLDSGRKIFIIENLSKTFLGFNETSHLAIMKLLETIQIAFLATSIGAILAIFFTFFSTKSTSWWGGAVNILLQSLFAVIRSLHPLITIIIAVSFAGLGPSAGVLAITLYSTAVLFVKFSDYAENHNTLKWSTLLKIYFPGIAFKYFPTNIVIATIIGFMGGGGIGFMLQQNINLLNYRDASVFLLAIIITISSIDLLSRAVWHNIQRTQAPPASIPEKEEIPA